nr:hypothetical protein [Tanacetum cinerariifolium]
MMIRTIALREIVWEQQFMDKSLYLNYNDPMDRALALHEVLNPFRKICVWKKAVGFLGSLPIPLQHFEWIPNYEGNICGKEDGDGQWHAEIRLTGPYGNIYDQGKYDVLLMKYATLFTQKSNITFENHILSQLTMVKPDLQDLNDPANTRLWRKRYFHVFTTSFYYERGLCEEIEEMLTIKVYEAGSKDEIFTSEA